MKSKDENLEMVVMNVVITLGTLYGMYGSKGSQHSVWRFLYIYQQEHSILNIFRLH